MSDEIRDPIPPGHGEPENVGSRPGDYCDCGRPLSACKPVAAYCECGRQAKRHGGAPPTIVHADGCPEHHPRTERCGDPRVVEPAGWVCRCGAGPYATAAEARPWS